MGFTPIFCWSERKMFMTLQRWQWCWVGKCSSTHNTRANSIPSHSLTISKVLLFSESEPCFVSSSLSYTCSRIPVTTFFHCGRGGHSWSWHKRSEVNLAALSEAKMLRNVPWEMLVQATFVSDCEATARPINLRSLAPTPRVFAIDGQISSRSPSSCVRVTSQAGTMKGCDFIYVARHGLGCWLGFRLGLPPGGLHPGGRQSASRGVCIWGGGVGIGGRGSASRGSGVCPPPVLTFSGGHCNSRYVSYWNAFLSGVILCFTLCLCLRILQQDVWKYPVSTGMIHCWTVRSQKRCQPKATVKVYFNLTLLTEQAVHYWV